jgi:hypothetical protein
MAVARSAVSDFGSEAGAATCPRVRSDAVKVAMPKAVTWAYTACQRPCTGGGGNRIEGVIWVDGHAQAPPQLAEDYGSSTM